MRHAIAIVGANGSGKTTLGRHLAEVLGYRHMDAEDYFFADADMSFANRRTKAEVQAMLLADMLRHPNFILTSVSGDYGSEINRLYDLIVYMDAPLDIRLARVKQRSAERFGSRVQEGGDMYEQEQAFFRFVASRTMDKTDTWLQRMPCPVLRIDGREPVEVSVQLILGHMTELQG